jgi:hypothetical protein
MVAIKAINASKMALDQDYARAINGKRTDAGQRFPFEGKRQYQP